MSHDNDEDPTGFEDEPLGEEMRPNNGPALYEFDGVDTAMAKAQRRRERRRRRNERTGKIAVAVFCVCLIIALILVFEVFKVTEKVVHDAFTLVTESPTLAPTRSPTATVHHTPAPKPVAKPTYSVITPSPTKHKTASPTDPPTVAPTISPQPSAALQSTYEMSVSEDTYLFLDGHDTGKSFGKTDTLLVQHGTKLSTKPGQTPDIPTSYIILKFELSKIDNFPDRSRWTEEMKIKLLLIHVPKDKEEADDRDDTTLRVHRIPNNYDLAVESWTGESFGSAPRSSREGVLVGTKAFSPPAQSVSIDITPSFHLSEEMTSSGLFTDDQILLMLSVTDGRPREGDEFRSRESDIDLPIPPRLQFVMV
jgi:hypothetical protein